MRFWQKVHVLLVSGQVHICIPVHAHTATLARRIISLVTFEPHKGGDDAVLGGNTIFHYCLVYIGCHLTSPGLNR